MNKLDIKWLPSLILATGIALSGYFIASSIRHFHDYSQFISVKGLSERNVNANKAIWNISYSDNAVSMKALYQSIHKSQEVIKAFVTNHGISDKSITYGSISTNKIHNDKTNRDSYSAYGTITITTHDIAKIKALSQQTLSIISQGVILSSSSVSYKYTDLNAIKPSMLVEATKNAKLAAEKFANNSGIKLGTLKNATQGLFTISNKNGSYGASDSQKVVRVVINAKYFLI